MYNWTVTTVSDAEAEATYTGYIEVKDPTDVTEVTARGQSVYPNPTDGDLHITDADGNLYEGIVTVYDNNGRVVMEKTIVNGYLNLSPLSSDNYNVVVKDAEYKIKKK